MPDDLFPHQAKVELGYPYAAWRGMKGYNGVAIFSRGPIEEDDDCARLVRQGRLPASGGDGGRQGGPVELHDFYVPAGGDIPDRAQNPKYGHKLDFIAEARAWFAAPGRVGAQHPGGDLKSPRWSTTCGAISNCSTWSATRRRRPRGCCWQATGFVDAVRHFVPAEEKLFTWWSYRNRDWRLSDRGRRLDHVWVTPDLQGALRRQTCCAMRGTGSVARTTCRSASSWRYRSSLGASSPSTGPGRRAAGRRG